MTNNSKTIFLRYSEKPSEGMAEARTWEEVSNDQKSVESTVYTCFFLPES